MHKRVEFDHNGERSREESAWTWECSCGATESCHLKSDALLEWHWHLEREVKVAKSKIDGIVLHLKGEIEKALGRSLSDDQAFGLVSRLMLEGFDSPRVSRKLKGCPGLFAAVKSLSRSHSCETCGEDTDRETVLCDQCLESEEYDS